MLLLPVACSPRNPEPTTPRSGAIVALDFVKSRPGERDRLVRFYQLNWAELRTVLQARGDIVSFRMLVSADTGSAWDVLLETVYPDSQSFARREEMFAPLRAGRTLVLVDGRDRSSLGDILFSRAMRIDAARP